MHSDPNDHSLRLLIRHQVKENLGLRFASWTDFTEEVKRLNSNAPPGTLYKVLFLGRHGEGWHNVAERKYGRDEWNRYWARQEGDAEGSWVDARLTETGLKQASTAANFWKEQMTKGLPAPDSYYTSPLSRCLQTCHGTFGNLQLPSDRPFKPVVKELLRETLGRHACDRRSSMTELRSFIATFARPDPFVFEPGFSEVDALWKPEPREMDEDTQARQRIVLDEIFNRDKGQFISITSHSGAVRAMLEVVGHRLFRLGQGSVMAVLVKAEQIEA
ncbi:hypothetical protein, variant [Verruconis gallopava]|uniref:Phosphoglycerate mutase n=1 Tax=Verruconis gallopava TaxID=253628 RepID=A0A0D2AZ26_9PEZI|nr:hypothetical protein, variant [Verruconis gallopava]KIW04404.1 hypothetical protein, variant [Verruconis gallopava]